MDLDATRALLDPLVARYERAAFIPDDPVSAVWAFDDPEDQEVIGLYAALLAWGRRSESKSTCRKEVRVGVR